MTTYTVDINVPSKRTYSVTVQAADKSSAQAAALAQLQAPGGDAGVPWVGLDPNFANATVKKVHHMVDEDP